MRQELVAETFAAEAPLTKPAMSTKESRVGLILTDFASLASVSSRGSGTSTSPTRGSTGAERIIRRLRGRRRGQRVEDGRLAHVGQPKNAALEAHCTSAPFPKFVIQLSTL